VAEIVVKEEHDGRTVSAKVGDSLTVELPENPTTGFRWAPIDSDASTVALETDEFVLGSKGAVGGGGTRVFRLRVKGLGRARLQFELMRAWESNAPSKLFEIHISVQ
jgi:inhibitor of cysteine peptidase